MDIASFSKRTKPMKLYCSLLFLILPSILWGQDVVSGPEANQKVPALKVFDATGTYMNKEVDYSAERKERPTVYLLIAADKWDRPMARFLRQLDESLPLAIKDAYIVAVWLTDDVNKTKEYLPLVQQSLQFEVTALTCYPGEKGGPEGWNINTDAHLTAVVVTKGKVVKSAGYRTIDEKDVAAILSPLKKPGGK